MNRNYVFCFFCLPLTHVYTEYNLDMPSCTGHISLISLLTNEFKSLFYSYIKKKSKIVLLSISNLLIPIVFLFLHLNFQRYKVFFIKTTKKSINF